MSTWHGCENTHCWAGWIVTLAGDKGEALERRFDTPLAAMMIYEKSTGRKISPVRFFEENTTALKHMKKLANGNKSSINAN